MFIITEQQHILLQKLEQIQNEDKQRSINYQNRPLRPSLFLNDINSIVNNSVLSNQQQKNDQLEDLHIKLIDNEQISTERKYIKLPKIGRFSNIQKSTVVKQVLSHQNSPIRINQDSQQLNKKYSSKTPIRNIRTPGFQGNSNVSTLFFKGNSKSKKKVVQFNPEIKTINEAGLICKEYIENNQRRFKRHNFKLHTQVN
ncbi:unnamed protein product [Paramecium pentaurelia]|uniref:Uncharacterized protein n=1 Tax=Paramecium pentaurelia TaxID=43138 RepID=A0A8S1TXN7_9CILI|nr:unnamed protein product [Paramecium pentaurelia]